MEIAAKPLSGDASKNKKLRRFRSGGERYGVPRSAVRIPHEAGRTNDEHHSNKN
jgi:hypothetical protein